MSKVVKSGNAVENQTHTVKNTSMNPRYTSYVSTERIFCRPAVDVKPNMLEKDLRKFFSPNIYASFGTFWVEIGS